MAKKKSLVNRLANALIGLGLLCVLIFGVYEGVTYPWKQLLASWGLIELTDQLPQPAPLPDSVTLVPPDEREPPAAAAVPSESDLLASRPAMELAWLGVLKIPRIQISENIVEGSDNEMLYGVGHVRGTAMPGEKGNCVLAAHRNYIYMRPFRYLDKMETGDYVYVEYGGQVYTYEVFRMFEVGPNDSWVLQVQEEEENLLTLLTCTPVLTFTHRLIVWARLVDTQPLAA